jgi:hypothetical protein
VRKESDIGSPAYRAAKLPVAPDSTRRGLGGTILSRSVLGGTILSRSALGGNPDEWIWFLP